MKKTLVFLFFVVILSSSSSAQEIAVLKYGGGGDWYANPTALPNLISFCNQNINTKINPKPETVEPSSIRLFQYPFVYMTGHGNVFFTEEEAENLRTYLLSGGFIHVDDNYGLREFFERELKKIFPEKELSELGKEHPIFDQNYKFPNGLPKIHEHDGKRPEALGIFHENRLVLLFTFESDLGDGWEDPSVHKDPEEVRNKALQMGANIVEYVFKS